ncbi:phosphopantetheine-binding protein [Streptomyces cahuitamycinicus]|uniref:Carrier domain-containing protein n=1 Tax=Streptomyces cahuitamycinicus TaxID=2070367 RepID=A0A2N8TXU5_9ACTN|nr:phosphopantetheine-binding protein [Streptomyces cahuitamycinicus]PNG23828.1 hypothetical protein C1J00_01760 [Streptomyces cahuitamycinicus]
MDRDRSALVAVTITSARHPDNGGTPAPKTPDRTALPLASQTARVREPAGDVVEFMIRAWSKLLGCSDLTEHSDFFARGGDSLLITRLMRYIAMEFGVTTSLRDMSRRNLGDQVALVHSLLPGDITDRDTSSRGGSPRHLRRRSI